MIRGTLCIVLQNIPVNASLVMPDDLRSYRAENLSATSPDGKYPVFQHGDQKFTGSVDAMLAYIEETFENPPLLPNGLEKEVARWVSYIRDTFTVNVLDILHNGDPYAQDSLEARLNESLARLDSGIKPQGKHFLGSKFTLVDVYLIPFLSLVDLVTYVRGFTIDSSYSRLLSYKFSMCKFKCYKPVQVGVDLSKDILVKSSIERPPLPLVSFALLQHKSITWHLEAFVKLVKEFDGINRKPFVDTMQRTVFGTRLKELPIAYGRLLEILQEHAQMEERIIFPALEMADQGL